MQKQITNQRLGPWLALFHVPHLSLPASHQLLEHLGSPEAIFQRARSELSGFGLKNIAIEAIQAYRQSPEISEIGRKAGADLSWMDQPDRDILCFSDPRYPELLKQISSPPLVLFVIGDPAVLQRPQIAMVGSRNPSLTGRDTAGAFAKHLARSGIAVTSGLAIGIDGASHAGALDGGGPTVAVMATGADKLYPTCHLELAGRIAANGALISEFPLGTPPRPSHFPQRNRIISGLSLGTLVVEAALKSGSLITAKFAVTQNREVFAIPGSIHNPMSKGCHALIRQGAKLVEETRDIIDEISNLLPASAVHTDSVEPMAIQPINLDASDVRVFKLIGFDVISMDVLMMHAELSIAELTQHLIQLELLDYIKAVDGGFVRKINRD